MHNPCHQEHRAYVPTAEEMEARYQSTERLWSANPNETLVDYAAKLTPGTALDIGCGEGADALWLKNHGWEVLGIDFAPTAVARTNAHGVAARGTTFNDFSHEPFDLVSVHYGGVGATPKEVEELERLVAPGGTLLFVHHDMESAEVAMPEWLAENLRELETVELTRRERHLTEGAGAHHQSDVVLGAKRAA